jgi:hypothetical protein
MLSDVLALLTFKKGALRGEDGHYHGMKSESCHVSLLMLAFFIPRNGWLCKLQRDVYLRQLPLHLSAAAAAAASSLALDALHSACLQLPNQPILY